MEKMIAFLTDLAEVLEKHKGGLLYTTRDDGIHATVDGEDCCIGWPDDGNAYRLFETIAALKAQRDRCA